MTQFLISNNMKTYTISIDNRESMIETLWNEMEANSSKEVCFVCTPGKNEIVIHDDITRAPLATINLVKVSDDYDVKRDLFY